MMRVQCQACHGRSVVGDFACRACNGRGHVYMTPTPLEIAIRERKEAINKQTKAIDPDNAVLQAILDQAGI